MQLKSLQLQGFKSFPEKTTLNFEGGITAIVGPNGSGKSNVADAIRWVLGEQSTKNLRGKKMEDVIFGGAKGRSSMGVCSVAITFDNKERLLPIENDEVTVLRKLYRSGESEYKINEKTAKLRDLNELFMDTGLGRDGYSIIGQGKIADIVGAKNKERREIFEEAAGISRFRYRRSEAEKKLEDTYENLLRLKDIMVELEDRVEPLRVQAEKAEKFIELSQSKKTLEISIWVNQINSIKQRLDKLRDSLLNEQNNLGDIEAVLEDKEKQIESYYLQIQKCIAQIDAKRRETEQLRSDVSEKDASIAVLRNDLEHNFKNIEQLEDESQKGDEQKKIIEKKLDEQKEKIQLASENLEQLVKIKENMEKSLEEKRSDFKSISTKLEEKVREKLAFESEISNQMLLGAGSKTLIDETKSRLSYYDEVKISGEKNLTFAKAEVEDCEKLLAELERNIEQSQNKISGYKLKFTSAKQSLGQALNEKRLLENEQNGIYQRVKILEELEKNMEGVGHSVKHIMSKARHGIIKGIDGTVASVINVSKEHTIAIEVALGKKAENIIVQDEKTAKDCINVLKQDKAGRATFLPMTTIKPQSLRTGEFESEEGYLGTADKLVQCDEKYKTIVESLLGKIAIVTDIDCGINIAKKQGYSFKIVTLDGQVINAGGSFTGGSVSQKTGLLTRRVEIFEQQEKLENINEKIKKSIPLTERLEAECANIEAKIQLLEKEERQQMEEKITYTSELKRLRGTYENTKLEIERANTEREQAEKKLASLMEKNTSYEDVIVKLRAEAEQSGIGADKLREEKSSLAEQLAQQEGEYTQRCFEEISSRKDYEVMLDELKRQEEAFAQLGLSANEVLSKIEIIKSSCVEIKQKIELISREKEENIKKSEILQKEIQELIESRNSLEEKSTGLRNSEKDFIAKREKASSIVCVIEEKKISVQKSYDEIIAKLWDEYGLVRSEAENTAEPILDMQLAEQRLRSLKQEIKTLGSVNVAAVEEYKEISQRYKFMKAQLEDVEKTRQELKRMINDITKNMQEIFTDSFEKIAENFSEVFKQLFGGGNARLALTEPDDVLESGIDIFVEPPGKIIKNIALLSGGEQAFVAIAIYFAILKVRPTPFCVLDEIEAALDEVNVVKYAQYLQAYKQNTQFIAITHRRGTMEAADLLYGVTMQQEGISKVLKLDLKDVGKIQN